MTDELAQCFTISMRSGCSAPPHFMWWWGWWWSRQILILNSSLSLSLDPSAIHTYVYCMTVCLFVCVRTSRSKPPRTRPEAYYMYIRREREREREGHILFCKDALERECSRIEIILSLPKSHGLILSLSFHCFFRIYHASLRYVGLCFPGCWRDLGLEYRQCKTHWREEGLDAVELY